ncbi:MAG: bifunctional UDP-N-acetylmuramoyl-tripeptide:D-alanyl-D-alanine ligase/alanine racemase [Bacteroidetes bacterium]|nr:bifunctional UDP-N-acetylmuramoyl-tripeptide:D-alanyl-D-alanine ligase/alanine racemase [Bacteroidota bacterium]
MQNTVKHIAQNIAARFVLVKASTIEHLLIDSRRLIFPETSLFFSLKTAHQNGHDYIADLVQRGVNNFVVDTNFDASKFPTANFIFVDNVYQALQKIAKQHRALYAYPVIGITGSNGKTMVKEWLSQLLANHYNIVKSPRSYNSQIGVPLSVWGMTDAHNLAIFEAGISIKGEMQILKEIIEPTIGIFTNLGTAHQEGFANEEEKLKEKWIFFKDVKTIIAPYAILDKLSINKAQQIISWGEDANASLYIVSTTLQKNGVLLQAIYGGATKQLNLPFTDKASIENVISCWATLLFLAIPDNTIQAEVLQLKHLEMRMQIKKGVQQCYLLNDSYSNDLSSMALALDYAKQQAGLLPITLVVSDFVQSNEQQYQKAAALFNAYPVKKIITIGMQWTLFLKKNAHLFSAIPSIQSYQTTHQFLTSLDTTLFKEEFILLKGARIFEFEKINAALQFQTHQTQLEVNLSALVHNFKAIKNKIGPEVKIMAIVKAFGYGTGSTEIARVLQFHHVDYLAVAYADEGVELRKAGIHLPIMVMNVDLAVFDTLVQYHLEPEIFSLELLEQFAAFVKQQAIPNFPIHLKLNTGMNRLGFDEAEIKSIGAMLKKEHWLKVQSIFSHLSASGLEQFKIFTETQLTKFNTWAAAIENDLGYSAIKHISNSGAILDHAKYHLNMVRLGIGMFGIPKIEGVFENVLQLHTTISQLRKLAPSETVGYNRSGVLDKETIVATVRLGYADGYNRKLGNGKAAMWVNGARAAIIGSICMDMTMIDVTGIPNVKVGDQVEVFGPNLPIEALAAWADTIPYEILTSIGQRVKRVYIQD